MELDWTQPTMKAASLLVSAFYVHLSLSPPNPPVRKEECYCQKENINTLFETFIQYITFCSKTMVWLGVIVELLVSASHYASPSITARWSLPWLAGAASLGPPPWAYQCSAILVLGASLAMTGALLRLWCFRTLGPLFTFEITIRPKHELVTIGPYAWVRHPSYAGVYITLIGASLVLTAPGTWLSTHGLWTPAGGLFAAFWCIKCVFAFRGTCLRLTAEDKVLKETFGAEWEDYATKVPWRLVPWVF